MANVEEWKRQAEKKQQLEQQNYINNNQHIIDAVNQQKQAALDQLKNENTTAINKLEQSKRDISSEALTNAKQANINRLLALKDNKNALNRAGLGTQGLVGSQVNSINSDYGNNLNDILLQKANSLRGVDSQISDTNLQYNTNLATTASNYATTLANTKAGIEEQARQAGLKAYDNEYNAWLQQWQNEMEQKKYEESIRQYNETLAFQKLQQQQSNSLAWAQLQQQQKQYNFGNGETSLVGTKAANGRTIINNPYTGNVNNDAKYGVFNTGNGTGYQPNNIGGQMLSKLGKTVGQLYGSNSTNSSGVNIANQNIWTLNGNYYIWNGSANRYEQIAKR